ncbi:MAG TPA: invasin domain 3-containing protein [Longimicrobium sp.]|nr:invasin domain 3-containing protein [Longimicrobium sp.]
MIAGAAWLAATSALSAQAGTAPVRGDVDGDGRITTADAMIVSDYLVGRPVPPGANVAERGDVNGDGRVTSVDAAIIRASAAGRDVSRFKVGTAVGEVPANAIAELTCTADVSSRSVRCSDVGDLPNGARGIIIGNQGVNVKLTSSNVVSNNVGGVIDFTFDVTVQNLTGQSLGTVDGTTAHAEGVRVFFHQKPTANAGSGEVDVLVPAGNTPAPMGTYTGSNQSYYSYAAPLKADSTTAAVNWHFKMPSTVTNFQFKVFVAAEVQYPGGWIDIYPPAHAKSPYFVDVDSVSRDPAAPNYYGGAPLQLVDSVRNAVGKYIPNQTVTWASSGHGAVTVDGTGLVSYAGDGVDTVTASNPAPAEVGGGFRIGRKVFVVQTADSATSTITANPTSLPVGDSSLITVQLKNTAGVNLTHSGGAVVLSASNGATLTAVTNNNDGTYTAKVTSTTAGVVTVSGTLNGHTIVNTAIVTFGAGAPANLVKSAGDLQTANAGAAVTTPPAVTVTDQYGNPVPGATVTFSVTGGGGSTTGATPATNGSGVATVGSWTLGSGPSTNTLQASLGALTPVTFTGYVPPTAGTDVSEAVGNFTLPSTAVTTVLTNDASINGGTVVLATPAGAPQATIRLGSVTFNGDGTFSYTPAAGVTGRDSIQYLISDGKAAGTSSGWLKFSFVGKVWFVDSSNGGAADGRSGSPFPSISAAEAVAGVNDTILVRTGGGVTAGGTLKAGQTVFGQHTTAFTVTVNTDKVLTLLATGTRPSMGALTLASGNTLRGFTSTGGITGSTIGTLTVGDVAINNAAGQALSLANGTLTTIGNGFLNVQSAGGTNNVSLTGVATGATVTLGTAGDALTGATSDGVVISGGSGSFTIPGNVTNAASFAVNVNGKAGGTVTFSGNINPAGAARGISVTGNNSGANTIVFSGTAKNISSAAAAGVVLSNNTGATIQFTNGGLALASTTGTPFSATGGGTVEVTGSGNTVTSGAAPQAVNLNGVTIGSGGMQFASISATATTGSAVRAVSVGRIGGGSFTAASLTVAGTAGATSRGVELTTNSAPFTFTTVSVNGTGGEGIYLNGNTAPVSVNGGTVGNTSNTTGDALFVSGGGADVTVAATLTKSTAGRIANIGSRTAGITTVSGTLSCTGACTGINAGSNTGGTIDFSAATKTLTTGANAAVTLATNGAGTVNFSNGGLAITTTSGAGINATGSGTLTVTTGANPNTILTQTGTALTVTDVNIGTGGLTFRSITAGTAASGPANGMLLNNTGTSGFLTVTGDGSNPGSGGTIQRATGADGANAGNGVYLNGTRNVSLSFMNFNDHANNGVYGTGVRGLTMNKVRFTGNNGTSNSGTFNESAVQLLNLGGAVKFTGSRFDGGAYNAVRVDNSIGTSPVLDSLVFDNDTVTTMQGSTADVRGSALLVSLLDGTVDARFRNNRVLAWWSTGIHVLTQGTSSGTARISNNFVDNTNGALAGAMGIVAAGCRLGFNISANTVRHTNGAAISTDMSPGCVNTLQGTIDGNIIGVSGDANSGTATGVAIAAGARAGTTTVKISNNVLRQINGSASGAITTVTGDALGYGGSGAMNATITGNNIQESGTTVNNAQHGILVTHGVQSGPPNDTHQGCYDIQNNTIINFVSGTANNRIRVNQRFGTTSRFPGYTGAATGATSQTDLATYLLARNTASTSTNANTSTGGFLNTVPAGSACPQPTM